MATAVIRNQNRERGDEISLQGRVKILLPRSSISGWMMPDWTMQALVMRRAVTSKMSSGAATEWILQIRTIIIIGPHHHHHSRETYFEAEAFVAALFE